MRLRSVVVVILPAILLGGLLTVLFARPQQRKAPQPSPPPLPPRPTCWGWAREGAVQAEFCSAFEGGWKTTPIPNRLWQRKPDPQASSTHHTSHDFSHTWKDLNPGIRVKQHGDKEADAFISKWFTDQVTDLYHIFPLRVIQVNFWRMAALFFHGGVYADIDIRCVRPTNKWLELSPPDTRPNQLAWVNRTNCKVVIGLENDQHFCPWTLAATAGHPLLAQVMELMIQSAQGGIMSTDIYKMQHHSGQGVLTQAVSRALGMGDGQITARHILDQVYSDPARFKAAMDLGLCLVDQPFFNGRNAAHGPECAALPSPPKLDWRWSNPTQAAHIQTLMSTWQNKPIPYTLWQTYGGTQLTAKAQEFVSTWTGLNPGLQVNQQNDLQASEFIKTWYSDEVAQVWQSYPLGVMRADMWRYAALFINGGIYADMDVKCLRPYSQWWQLQPPDNRPNQLALVKPDTCRVLIGLEYDLHFCQWSFAAVPGHPVFAHIIDRMVRRGLKLVGKTIGDHHIQDVHFVHSFTGPGIFTMGILDALGLPETCLAREAMERVYSDPVLYKRAQDLGICLVDYDFFNKLNVQNGYASQQQNGVWPWDSWINQMGGVMRDSALLKVSKQKEKAAAALGKPP